MKKEQKHEHVNKQRSKKIEETDANEKKKFSSKQQENEQLGLLIEREWVSEWEREKERARENKKWCTFRPKKERKKAICNLLNLNYETQFHPGRSPIDTAEWMHYLDTN